MILPYKRNEAIWDSSLVFTIGASDIRSLYDKLLFIVYLEDNGSKHQGKRIEWDPQP
jgi:hypothetical protein